MRCCVWGTGRCCAMCYKVGGCGCACSLTVGGVVEIQSVMALVSWSSAMVSTLGELRLCRMIVPASMMSCVVLLLLLLLVVV